MADGVAWISTVELHGCVRMAQAGDEGALSTVLRLFRPLVRKTAAFYANVSFEDAEQEGYVALLECVRKYRQESGVPFAGYAQAKVRGDVRTAMRRLWTYRDRVARLAAGDGGDVEVGSGSAGIAGTIGDNHGLTLLRLSIEQAGLSPREQISIEGLIAGYTCAEIAAQQGVGVETAKTWRKRALRKLRAALGGME